MSSPNENPWMTPEKPGIRRRLLRPCPPSRSAAEPWIWEKALIAWKNLRITGISHGIMECFGLGAHPIPIPLHWQEWRPKIPGSQWQLLQIPQDFVLPPPLLPDLPSRLFGIHSREVFPRPGSVFPGSSCSRGSSLIPTFGRRPALDAAASGVWEERGWKPGM